MAGRGQVSVSISGRSGEGVLLSLSASILSAFRLNFARPLDVVPVPLADAVLDVGSIGSVGRGEPAREIDDPGLEYGTFPDLAEMEDAELTVLVFPRADVTSEADLEDATVVREAVDADRALLLPDGTSSVEPVAGALGETDTPVRGMPMGLESPDFLRILASKSSKHTDISSSPYLMFPSGSLDGERTNFFVGAGAWLTRGGVICFAALMGPGLGRGVFFFSRTGGVTTDVPRARVGTGE